MAASLFAGIRVGNIDKALAWYEMLFGEPAFQPHEAEMVWEVNQSSFVYINESKGSGSSLVTVFVDDLEATVSEISARGLEPTRRETYSNGVRKVTYLDPEGNEIGIGGPPEG